MPAKIKQYRITASFQEEKIFTSCKQLQEVKISSLNTNQKIEGLSKNHPFIERRV
ncbi:hypothetical protein JCM15548_13067 [Geofilum rubicundum JCM 15548]|uniref:Uncharacterized protein n=1 Tax=Geofilum rubicundum JCM 15548 TaxID=1236989 RepID=A0A0E9M046_9BACT|nr:hypothetical protein JCM15548_13067 [Geofilum rubicundum JCM 15548]